MTHLAASRSSDTLLLFPSPSLKVVLLATVKVPFLVMKSGKHLCRTEHTHRAEFMYQTIVCVDYVCSGTH